MFEDPWIPFAWTAWTLLLALITHAVIFLFFTIIFRELFSILLALCNPCTGTVQGERDERQAGRPPAVIDCE